MTEEWKILWRGCRPGPIKEDDDGFYRSRICDQGIAKLDDIKKVDDFISEKSVSFGEDGGFFHMLGGWEGTYNELEKGAVPFHTEKEIYNLIGIADNVSDETIREYIEKQKNK